MRNLLSIILFFAALALCSSATWAKTTSKPVHIKLKILEGTGGTWSKEAAFAFAFADKYSINAGFAKICLQHLRTKQSHCQNTSIQPDASLDAQFPASALKALQLTSAQSLVHAVDEKIVRLSLQIGKRDVAVASAWLGPKAIAVRGLALWNTPSIARHYLQKPELAKLAYQQLAHMFSERSEKNTIFRYVVAYQKDTVTLPTQTPSTAKPQPTSRIAPKATASTKPTPPAKSAHATLTRPIPPKKTKPPIKPHSAPPRRDAKSGRFDLSQAPAPLEFFLPSNSSPTKIRLSSKAFQAWLYHLQTWVEFQSYHTVVEVCSLSYSPKKMETQYNALSASQKEKMLRTARGILEITARSFRLLGDSKVSTLLQTVADGIRICQWSAFFVESYLKYYSTNAKRAFWREPLISQNGFLLGLMAAFCMRFARNLLEDVVRLIQLAQTMGYYAMVVVTWLFGKKYTGMKDLFCKWGDTTNKLCHAAGTAYQWGQNTYRVLRSGYRIGAKGVRLTIKYSKKLYRGVRGAYDSTMRFFFKRNLRKGKAYCSALARARNFFLQENLSLDPKEWSPKVCIAP